MLIFTGKYASACVMIDDVEKETIEQIFKFVNDDSFSNPIVVMPDTHAGKGAVIGFTMPFNQRVIPNVVGVDIACGMYSVKLHKDALNGIHLNVLDERIRAAIPMAQEVRRQPGLRMNSQFDWALLQKEVSLFASGFRERTGLIFKIPTTDEAWFGQLCRRVGIDMDYAVRSIGTLGSGNHFIEVGRDEEDFVWVTVHSGSRNLGLKIANHWQKVAVARRMERLGLVFDKETEIHKIKATYPKENWNDHIRALHGRHNKNLSSNGLEYLEGEDMYSYLIDSVFAYQYARHSRKLMSNIVLSLLGNPEVRESINTVHNYIDHHDFIIRKGAIASYKDHLMVVPFNMEDGLLICEGKSNPEWNFSAPHGAGRLFSRTKAKAELNVDAARSSMKEKGIYTSVLPPDELRGAYKPAEVIEQAIEPTASIVHRVRPILNLKAGE